MAQPQKCLDFFCNEHWYGASPSSASFPLIMRDAINGPKNKYIKRLSGSTIIGLFEIQEIGFLMIYLDFLLLLRLYLH